MRSITRPLLLAAIGLSALHAQDGLPKDDNHDLYVAVCGACHGADIVIGSRNSRENWTDIVQQMRDRGAAGTDADFVKVVDYLVKYFGPKPASATPAKPVAAVTPPPAPVPDSQKPAAIPSKQPSQDKKPDTGVNFGLLRIFMPWTWPVKSWFHSIHH